MMYNVPHGELLARLSAVAQARVVAIEQSTERRQREMIRHEREMRTIRDLHEGMNQKLAEILDEAARKRVPQSIIAETVGLSRTRLHQLRKGAR